MHWKTLSSEYLSKHQYFTARKDKCETSDGRIVPEYFVVELPTSVCALGITEDNKAILVKQYRHPVDKVLLELPGGFIDANEDPKKAIERELLEETGYRFDTIEEVGETAANPGVLNNYTKLYLATMGKKVAEQKLDYNEEIELELVPLDELINLLLQNKIGQSMHTNCIFYALLKMGRLKVI
jgi:ADP-ribose pyrophosphatase